MSRRTLELLRRRLADRRSGEVIFVSHCLLNENVRYLGGACRPGAVDSLVDNWRANGYGICQMACPEQRAWGGVLKRHMATAYGSKHLPIWPLHRLLLGAFICYTKARYWLLARRVAAEVADYRRSGYRVAGIVGVAGSPSCGVRTTLDVGRWLEVVAQYDAEQVTRADLNRDAVIGSMLPGEGWFTGMLFSRLSRLSLAIPRLEHDLASELQTEES